VWKLQLRLKSLYLIGSKAGYRHIDTAWIYGTEKAVGDAIKESGIPREDIWVTSKLGWCNTSRVEESVNESLKKAGLEYFDMVCSSNRPIYALFSYVPLVSHSLAPICGT
jgi:glycerol 2-dehydrogenase (NADP+)